MSRLTKARSWLWASAALGAGALGIFAITAACSNGSPATPPFSSPGPFGDTPPVSSTTPMNGLSGPVDVVRDKNGIVHIWATKAVDALRVEGYQVAKDRTVQLQLLRRFAEGRTAELLGDSDPSLIDQDIVMRTVGLERVAQQIYDALPPGSELKTWLDAYADGVSQFNANVQNGLEALPKSMVGISPAALRPWTGVDSLAVGRLQSWELAYTADSEIAQTAFAQAGAQQFHNTTRSGFDVDVLHFAPLDPTLAIDGFPNDTSHTMALLPVRRLPTPRVAPALLSSTRSFVDATRAVRDRLGKLGVRGSNDWVVGPQLTATGHAMLANDPHLSLSAPAVFWMVQIDAHDPSSSDTSQDIHVAGTAFPGIPGVILGFNQNVAWGATTADYDVTDVYSEQLTADGKAVVFNGQNVPLQVVHEQIAVAGKSPLTYDVLVVPHHGPIVPTIVSHAIVPPDPARGALSIAWTGLKPTNELAAVAAFLRATSVEDFRAAVRDFEVGAQNWVVADTGGNIFYTTQSRIPLRDKRAYTWDPASFTGTLPCFVEPGDGTAEWTGAYLDEGFVPHAKNPARHYVATANGDQVGGTLDNDPSNDTLPNGQPIYLACWHDPGFRVGRIHHLIDQFAASKHPITLDDMATIQGDARSALGALLAKGLVKALEDAQAEVATPGSHGDLTAVVSSARYKAAPVQAMHDLLVQWGTSDYDTPAGVSLDDGSLSTDPAQAASSQATLVFQTWLMRVMQAVLGDELTAINQNPPPFDYHDLRVVTAYLLSADPKTLATYDPFLGDSLLFDDMTTPNVVESRDERQVTSLLDALDYLNAKLGTDRTQWRWGKLHTLRFGSLVSLWGSLSIPPVGDGVFPNGFPRHGDGFNVDVGEPDGIPLSLFVPADAGPGADAGDAAAGPLVPADIAFGYSAGPTQRFVIDMDPSGPVPRNVLPGGEIWDNASPHFADEALLWRHNQNHPIPFAHDDVAAAAEERVTYTPATASP